MMKQIFDDYCDSTPESETEINETSIVWHYRNVDPAYGEYQTNNLLLHLQGLPKLPIEFVSGEGFLKVRAAGVNKGVAVKKILEDTKDGDFVCSLGAECMLEEVRKHPIPFSTTITVNPKSTKTSADYYISQGKVLNFLSQISKK